MKAEDIRKLTDQQLEAMAEKVEMLDRLIDRSSFDYDDDNLGGIQLIVSLEAVEHCDSTYGQQYHDDVLNAIRKAMKDA